MIYVEYDPSPLANKVKWNFKHDSKVTCCPHCGCDEFYRKLKFSGVSEYNYHFDGRIADNSELHTGCRYNERKTVYCRDCNKPLGVVEASQ